MEINQTNSNNNLFTEVKYINLFIKKTFVKR